MRKVFVSFAVVALVCAAVSCGNKSKKADEQAAAEIASVEEAVDSVAAVADSTVAAVDPVVAQ
jgi:predicted small lipoprotein YifL